MIFSMSDPTSLSRAFIEAFNARDLDTIASMVADPTDYKRSGASTVSTRDDVRARYARDFETTPDIHAEMVHVVAASDTEVAFEIVVTTSGFEVPGAAHHRWEDGLMTRYRSWVDAPAR